MSERRGANLTAEQILVIKFAAAVLDAEVAGRRTSQAARDLRGLLPADHPTSAGEAEGTSIPAGSYATIHDHVGNSDDEDDECQGHESLHGAHMGEAVYCDGTCRR